MVRMACELDNYVGRLCKKSDNPMRERTMSQEEPVEP